MGSVTEEVSSSIRMEAAMTESGVRIRWRAEELSTISQTA